MALYMLQDCYGGQYYSAGDTASTSDFGGSLPANWTPCGAVDTLDASAAAAYWAQGPQPVGLVRARWSTHRSCCAADYEMGGKRQRARQLPAMDPEWIGCWPWAVAGAHAVGADAALIPHASALLSSWA
jgi:hypothetical protein